MAKIPMILCPTSGHWNISGKHADWELSVAIVCQNVMILRLSIGSLHWHFESELQGGMHVKD